MIFYRPNGGRLLIHQRPLQCMLRFRQADHLASEAGGILMGRLIRDSGHIVIDDVTSPFASDRRTRFSFDRSVSPHQSLLNRLWTESDHTTTYLGEWHTHPEWAPTPSTVDINDWARLAHRHKSLLFIIVGIGETRVWEGNLMKGDVHIQRLKQH